MAKQTLFDLSSGFNNILDLALDDTMDLNVLEEGLQTIEAELTVKCQNGIGLIRHLEALHAGMKAEATRLTAQARFLKNRIDSIKTWYAKNLDAMGKSKVATEFGTMRVQNNPHSYPHELWQRDKIPKKYFDVVPEHLELNIDRVKDDLKANVEVPGAWRTQTRGLRIQ